jgi:hypothetical protein
MLQSNCDYGPIANPFANKAPFCRLCLIQYWRAAFKAVQLIVNSWSGISLIYHFDENNEPIGTSGSDRYATADTDPPRQGAKNHASMIALSFGRLLHLLGWLSSRLGRFIVWSPGIAKGTDVQRLLPQLATYLGHVHLAATQRYLTMTPELLQEACQRFERYAGEVARG